ncbi:MAG: hypothetical protein M1504_00485 [Candidatus Marsarchaeota archaeon]|nr:hypothetical protein [Candidatus Marsarchaeota archaeon]
MSGSLAARALQKPQRHYIGVSGIENGDQAIALLRSFMDQEYRGHDLLLGLIVSYKSVSNIKGRPLTLDLGEINQIAMDIERELDGMRDHPPLFLTLHYFTKKPEEVQQELLQKVNDIVSLPLWMQLNKIVMRIYTEHIFRARYGFGVQVNQKWPEQSSLNLERLKSEFPKTQTILQISDTFDLRRIKRYEGLDYALVDRSRGEGVLMDVEESVRVGKEIASIAPNLSVGYAGGINDENASEVLKSLIRNNGSPSLNVDMEGGVRTNDFFDVSKATKAVSAIIGVLRQKEADTI